MHIAGFEVADAIALLRLDDLFIESFEIKDVKVKTLPAEKALAYWRTLRTHDIPACLWAKGHTHVFGWSLDLACFSSVQTLRGEHLSRCIGRISGKVRQVPLLCAGLLVPE